MTDILDIHDMVREADDDEVVGKMLTRREVLRLLGIAGVTTAAGCAPRPGAATATTGAGGTTAAISGGAATAATAATATGALAAAAPADATALMPSCIARPEATEGPYFVDEKLNRSDIRSDPATGALSPGTPLALAFLVSRVRDAACTPLENAMVDVWHCDAEGVYSDVQDPRNDTTGQQFLRGYQMTSGTGEAAFVSIFPGWYQGRAVHIHFKIRTDDGDEFTSQLFFDDTAIESAYSAAPYSERGMPEVPNTRDGIYDPQLLVAVTGGPDQYTARFDVGLLDA